MYSAKKCFIVSAVAGDIITMSTLLQLDVYGLVVNVNVYAYTKSGAKVYYWLLIVGPSTRTYP